MNVQPDTICKYCKFFQKENEHTKEKIEFCNSHKKTIWHIDACFRFTPKKG